MIAPLLVAIVSTILSCVGYVGTEGDVTELLNPWPVLFIFDRLVEGTYTEDNCRQP